MKISILQGAFFPVPPCQGGAVEKLWFELGKEFAREGHQVVHVSRRWKNFPDKEELEGVSHLRTSGFTTPRSLALLKFYDLVYTIRACRLLPAADILVTNTFWAPLISPARAGKIYVSVDRVPKGQFSWYSRAVRFRASSEDILRRLQAQLPANERSKVACIPNAVPFSSKMLAGDIGAKEKIILYVGRIHPEKGVEILLEALHLLHEKGIWSWQAQIVGPFLTGQGGGGEAYLHQLKTRWQTPNVTFTGPVFDTSELVRLYERCAIMCYPSIAAEGEAAPVAPREAMACGCALVVSDLPQFSDLVQHSVNGWIFDHLDHSPAEKLAESLAALMHNDGLRTTLGAHALQIQQSHGVPHIAERFIADFKSLA